MKKKYFDTAAFGREVKQDRLKEHIPRKYVANIEHISPRHLMAIENKGQPPSLNLMGSLCRRFDISAD